MKALLPRLYLPALILFLALLIFALHLRGADSPKPPTISTDLQIEFLKSYGDQATAALAAERAARAFETVRNKLIAVCGDKHDLSIDEKGRASCAPKAEPARPAASATPTPTKEAK